MAFENVLKIMFKKTFIGCKEMALQMSKDNIQLQFWKYVPINFQQNIKSGKQTVHYLYPNRS
jgi:hypothetical protein